MGNGKVRGLYRFYVKESKEVIWNEVFELEKRLEGREYSVSIFLIKILENEWVKAGYLKMIF